MSITIEPVFLIPMLLLWFLVYHVAYSLVAILRDRSLVCWSVGPLGLSVVGLREPGPRLVLCQLVAAAAASAVAVYGSLYALVPPPISGLSQSVPGEVATVMAPIALLTSGRLLGLLCEHHFPLWGEARVMVRVQRALTSGSRIFFTPLGQDFIREHFGATTGEFLRTIRSQARAVRPW